MRPIRYVFHVGLDAFAVTEEKRLRDVAADPKTSDADRAKWLKQADRIKVQGRLVGLLRKY